MPDKFFYPFIVIFIAGMIIFALSFGDGGTPSGTQIDPIADGYTAEGDSLRAVVASPGTTTELALTPEGVPAYIIAAAHVRRNQIGGSAGVFVDLSPIYEAAFAEKELEITVRARKSANNPSEQFQLSYHTASVGDSRPYSFDLTGQFEDYTIYFTPNKPKGDPASDFVGVWPDTSGQSRAMDIESFRVRVVTPDAQSDSVEE